MSVQSSLVPSSQTASVPRFLYRIFKHVMPMTRLELKHWMAAADAIPDRELRRQALASLQHKRFHADGGSVYAAADLDWTPALVRLIFAYQTISDYLDNLCDRSGSYDMDDFRSLHDAMRDAVEPGGSVHNYYRLRGGLDDGGYLQQLVQTCQESVQNLPGYQAVLPQIRWFAERYCELQEYKHIRPELRERQLAVWWARFEPDFPELSWWEFAAATGSTLGVFALFLAATRRPSEEEASCIANRYFPWVCGLHILLDYLIDLEEDRVGGDFNFVRCYESLDQARLRIREFARQSLHRVKGLSLSGGAIHSYVVKGLLGMYLSDRKVGTQPGLHRIRRLVWSFGPITWLFYGACKIYRVVR